MNRRYALRVSVVALAVGLALLPAAFINFNPSAATTASLPDGPEWPKVPTKGEQELNKILYQAKVTEVATVRETEKPIAEEGDDAVWQWIGFGALILTLIVPILIERIGRPKRESEDDDLPGLMAEPRS